MLDSQAGRSVLANTSYTLLLRQKPAMIKSIQNVFHLSESEKVLLLTARPGEGLLLMENEHSEINIIASKKEHEVITTNADEILKMNKNIPEEIKKTENNIDLDQRAHLKKDLNKAELRYLLANGFKEVKEKGSSKKKEAYIIIKDENESSSHIICIKEITDYLKQFTQDVKIYRTVKPDIVFNANGKKYAIEVETGKIANKKRTMEKVKNLKKHYDENWFFFVTDRNLLNYYSKFWKVLNKRTLKTRIIKIFKKSENS
jgi:hypothetical protein